MDVIVRLPHSIVRIMNVIVQISCFIVHWPASGSAKFASQVFYSKMVSNREKGFEKDENCNRA
jgi:hypothetical protein